ncbi:hypothetical protein [Carboxylicivirga caseinilyticus]|uniref:hypothetical protein n=1 Tax=Carboxylicivirga caseinilyticus TaxID=3417572 RepID=UPI003D34D3E2|nr:hypothetical protein [Marinilabiliaceae bacterium A049]
MKTVARIKIGFVFLLFVIASVSGVKANNIRPNGVFDSDEVLKLTLIADFNKLYTERDKAADYIVGRMVYTDKKDVELPVKLKVRGNFRLKESTCDFAPLKLKFGKEDVGRTLFKNNRKLKLVTHCKDSEEMLNSVIREYSAYRIYNSISEYSLKVRLVEINYVDENDGSSFTKFGFFIEDKDDMCARLGIEQYKVMNVTLNQLEEQEMVKMSMFQYMIGNEDWSVPMLHNVILVKDGNHKPYIAIPYDFDMSFFVNPPYRKDITGTAETVKIYKGDRVKFDELRKQVDYFTETKEEVLNMILDLPEMSIECKQRCVSEIEDFYAKLETKSSIRRNFMAHVK